MVEQTYDVPDQIIPMILKTMKWSLETQLFDNVAENSPTRTGIVKMGKFQDNPADAVVSIAVNSGDFEDPKFADGHIDHPDLQEYRIRNLPMGEVGGGKYWWRRFTVRVEVFFVRQGYDEETSINYAYEFYGRLLNAIENTQVGLLEDSFGERASGKPFLESTTFFQAGGTKKAIFHGKVYFRVLCWRP